MLATYTVPKVLVAQQNGQQRAVIKEAMGTISGAYDAYKLARGGSATSTTHGWEILQYMNYVRIGNNDTIDNLYGSTGSLGCNYDNCVIMHNGAAIADPMIGSVGTTTGLTFGGTTGKNYIKFWVDPNGKLDSTTANGVGGSGKTVRIFLYFNGKIKVSNDCESGDYYTANGTPDAYGSLCPGNGSAGYPPWFSWN